MKTLLKKVPLVRWLLDMRRELTLTRFQVTRQTRIQQHLYRQVLRQLRRIEGKDFPACFEGQTFSQNGEDGILSEILHRIGTKTKWFVEIGSGDGRENNTRLLLELDWRGVWIDGDEGCCAIAGAEASGFVDGGRLRIIQDMVTAENVDELLVEAEVPKEIDVLSLDLDLNTYHVWKRLEATRPLVAIIEYNGFFPADAEWVADYDPDGWWDGGIRMGAALKSIDALAREKGFLLVGCDLSGTNAFFVREDLAKAHFPGGHEVFDKYEPARPFLLNDPEHRGESSVHA